LGVLRFINVYFQFIWTIILYVYSSIIISINGLDIMVTLNSVYFEHIKLLCKIFLLNILCLYYKFIKTILLYLLKLLQMKLFIIILLILYILILIHVIKIKFQYYLWLNFLNSNILLHNDDDDIKMIGKKII